MYIQNRVRFPALPQVNSTALLLSLSSFPPTAGPSEPWAPPLHQGPPSQPWTSHLSWLPPASSVPEGSPAPPPVSLVRASGVPPAHGSRSRIYLPLIQQTFLEPARHWLRGPPTSVAGPPLLAPPGAPRLPQQRAASLGSNFNPEEGANRSFSKLFQSDSDKQIAGSPGG